MWFGFGVKFSTNNVRGQIKTHYYAGHGFLSHVMWLQIVCLGQIFRINGSKLLKSN